ncbi:enkurin [Episyrphus balteatus]|uniref:enkurin n=1 Tax=Episyrphus balteatus TaxID=286459 RepID=UPI002485EB40|nr:enkurin [Episyrphus balteatus]
MSLVYITYHNENIHDIEKPTSAEKHYKFPKYISIHRESVKNPPINQIECQGKKIISASRKYSHKTLGYAETPLDDPSKFLKKNGGIKWQRLNDHVCPPSKELPPIPKKENKHENASNEVNFIKKNIKRVKTATPQRVTPKYVDTAVGERHNLDGTGLVPKHVLSKKFGKTPTYLNGIRKALEENKCYKLKEPNEVAHGVQILSNADRNAILMGLRENHSELEKTYQLLPIFTDTHSKKQRKAKLEQELKRLEQDILLMESNPVILICDD